MIKPPDWYLIAKRQLEIEQRHPRRRAVAEEVTVIREPPRRTYAPITYRRTTISEQNRQDRQFCAVLGAGLLAYCIPIWAMAIAVAQQISA